LLADLLPSDPQEMIKEVASHQNFINLGRKDDFLTTEQAADLEQAMHERFYGRYSNDLEGFVARIQEIKANKSGVPAVLAGSSFNPNSAEGKKHLIDVAMPDLQREKLKMERDIALQLKMKQNSFEHTRKMEKSDLLKP